MKIQLFCLALTSALSMAPFAADANPPAQAAAPRGEAIFAGGCFWCVETAFEGLPGVSAVISGYTGGTKKDPKYEEVSSGSTGHAESVRVVFDPTKITYAKLLEVFWHNVDPTQKDAQFCDHGTQYRSGIFYLDEEQRKAAEASKKVIEQSKRFAQPLVTEITKGQLLAWRLGRLKEAGQAQPAQVSIGEHVVVPLRLERPLRRVVFGHTRVAVQEANGLDARPSKR